MSRTSPPPAAMELDALLAGVHQATGIDFRDWRPAALERRLRDAAAAEGLADPGALGAAAEREPALWPRIARALSTRPPAWFSDPRLYRALRTRIAPRLKTYPTVRIWVPEEPGAEEAVALAIVLAEEGLLERSRIYVTAAFEPALDAARRGRYDADAVRAGAVDYARSGGPARMEDYFEVHGGTATPVEAIRRRLVFGQHNLATDGSLNEFHLVLARRVLLEFKSGLRDRAHELIWESLPPLGVAAIPPGDLPPARLPYQPVDGAAGLFRRAC